MPAPVQGVVVLRCWHRHSFSHVRLLFPLPSFLDSYGCACASLMPTARKRHRRHRRNRRRANARHSHMHSGTQRDSERERTEPKWNAEFDCRKHLPGMCVASLFFFFFQSMKKQKTAVRCAASLHHQHWPTEAADSTKQNKGGGEGKLQQGKEAGRQKICTTQVIGVSVVCVCVTKRAKRSGCSAQVLS